MKKIENKPAQRKYSEAQRLEAFELYIAGQHTLDQIADMMSIPPGTIKKWHHKKQWVKKRKQFEEQLTLRNRETIEGIIAEAQPKVLKRHLDVGGKLESAVRDQIDRSIDEETNQSTLQPDELLSLGKAFNQSATVTGKAIGLHRNLIGNGSTLVLNQGGVVQVGTRPLGPATSEERVIEAEIVESSRPDMSGFED